MFKVDFYTSPSNESPVEEFLDLCQPSLRSKILRQLMYVEGYGLNPAIPNIRKITNTSLWELRILGKDNVGIICISITERQILVLHIFRKKKQKTPIKEINTALRRYNEYLTRDIQ